jgi:hypothetical protein
VLRLHRLLNLSKKEVLVKFSEPVRSSKIVNFQSRGQAMQLDGKDDGSWVPGLSGEDPSTSAGNTIDDPTDDTLDTLRRARALHKKAIRAINDYILAAKVNRDGSTPAPAANTLFSSSPVRFLRPDLQRVKSSNAIIVANDIDAETSKFSFFGNARSFQPRPTFF